MTNSATVEEIWSAIDGKRVLLPSSCGFPFELMQQLSKSAPSSARCEFVVGLVFGGHSFLDNMPAGVSCTTWQHPPGTARDGRLNYLPLRYSQLINTFASGGAYPVDAIVAHVAQPDTEGNCSFGVSPSYLAPLARKVPQVVGLINREMPVTDGHQKVNVTSFTQVVEIDSPLDEFTRASWTDEDAAVAHNVATLVQDGATLQIGLGSIPEALPQYLTDRKDLGVFGMMTDGVMDLMKSGVVNGSRYLPSLGAVEVGEVVGTKALFHFVDRNPAVRVVPSDYALSADTFAHVPRLIALNSAIEVDLFGQVNAETIGHRIVSGAGGQCDYMQGAQMSVGGLSVIAVRSTTRQGRSRIVHSLAPGSVVTTPRTAVSHVVTEFGVAELRGRTLEERARSMIAIASPDHRDALYELLREVEG